MGENTTISWTDHTFNPWWGCTRVSPGCENCYAETFDKRIGGDHWGPGRPRRVFSDKYWNEPLKWDAAALAAGKAHKVFCASMADIMDDEAPAGQLDRLWDLIDRTPNLLWQLLTKRPERYINMLPKIFRHRNVGLGATAEDQKYFDLRFPRLFEAAASVRGVQFTWISYEPALGPLHFYSSSHPYLQPDWVIFGGESGAGRRPMQEQWAVDLLKECRERGIRFFMKQYSAQTPAEGKLLIPAHMLIQEFPG
jgi:protein gp37